VVALLEHLVYVISGIADLDTDHWFAQNFASFQTLVSRQWLPGQHGHMIYLDLRIVDALVEVVTDPLGADKCNDKGKEEGRLHASGFHQYN